MEPVVECPDERYVEGQKESEMNSNEERPGENEFLFSAIFHRFRISLRFFLTLHELLKICSEKILSNRPALRAFMSRQVTSYTFICLRK